MEVLLLKATNISHTAADALQATCSTDGSSPVLVSDWSQQLTWQPEAREAVMKEKASGLDTEF